TRDYNSLVWQQYDCLGLVFRNEWCVNDTAASERIIEAAVDVEPRKYEIVVRKARVFVASNDYAAIILNHNPSRNPSHLQVGGHFAVRVERRIKRTILVVAGECDLQAKNF